MGLEDVKNHNQIRATAAREAILLGREQCHRLQDLVLFLTVPEIGDFFVFHFEQVGIAHLFRLLRLRFPR